MSAAPAPIPRTILLAPATALELGLPLITRDGLIRDWGSVRTVW